MDDNIMSQDQAELVLAPHMDLIGECLWNGWERWRSTELSVPISTRARANLVYDFVVAEAERTLGDREGLTLTDERGFLVVNVEEKLLLRFKKYRKGLATSGIPTLQRQMFEYQQLDLGCVEPVTVIVAGYELEAFQRHIERVVITCRVGSTLQWMIPVDKPAATAVVPMSPSSDPLPKTQVRSKDASKESAQEGS